jgi:hypothetical protein
MLVHRDMESQHEPPSPPTKNFKRVTRYWSTSNVTTTTTTTTTTFMRLYLANEINITKTSHIF